jgi:AAHS family 4-hydroxybenzoate transporter-like MFS transporter
MAAESIDVKRIIDEGAFSRYQVWIFALCFLLALLDGYDSQSLGAIAPAVIPALKLQPAEFGNIFSVGAIGVVIGTLSFGMLADRFGRKAMLITSVFIYGVFTLAMAFARDGEQLMILRFISSIGLGGTVPNALSLASEYLPTRMRASFVAVLWAALPAGGVLSGFAGGWLATNYGWPSVFLLGGALPVVVALFAIVALPDSLAFLVAVGARGDKIRAILSHVSPETPIPADVRFVSNEMKPPGAPIAQLFADGRAVGTLLIWVLFFMSFCSMLSIVAWSSNMVRAAGFSVAEASSTLGWFNVGSLVASLTVGALIDRFGVFRVLGIYFLAMALVIGAVGFSLSLPFALICALYVAVGFFTGGSNSGIIALGTLFYPVPSRGTGIGWAYALGRAGSFVGPLVGGWVVQAKWDATSVFAMIAAPALVALATTLVLKAAHGGAIAERAPAGA